MQKLFLSFVFGLVLIGIRFAVFKSMKAELDGIDKAASFAVDNDLREDRDNWKRKSKAGAAAPTVAESQSESYQERKGRFRTKLTKKGPAPQSSEWQAKPPAGIYATRYRSGNRVLKAYVATPKGVRKPGVPWPALVFLHGGFALGVDDVKDCEMFLNAGFMVFCPSYRGENGNTGNFELMAGEVEDAIAAVNTVAKLPNVDPERIYVFGHSIGGGIAALTSLDPEAPIRKCGSCGGLYAREAFAAWKDICPFDSSDSTEVDMRLLAGNTGDMCTTHIAYLGDKDEPFWSVARALESREKPSRLSIVEVKGDHRSSLEPAMQMFLEEISKDAPQTD